LPVCPTVQSAVEPAGVPERATDFLGLKAGGVELASLLMGASQS
jgi:hypothetical protein